MLVIGDSVSNGWTPVLEAKINATHGTSHSPGLKSDGGARSTSNFVNCFDYLLSTDRLEPLPLKNTDLVLMNFGLHDYNLGVAGVKEYRDEYQTGLVKTKKITDNAGATLVMLGTTPAHNVGTTNTSDVTVQALNAAAQTLAKGAGIQFVDLYAPLIAKCGPVPWADTGANACALCAPNCKKLSVHYSQAGYELIADLVWDAVGP